MKLIFRLAALVSMLCGGFHGAAQTPSYPEQDCIGAIQIDSPVHTVTTAYVGSGAIPQELDILNQGCLGSGEKNNCWYRISIYDSGSLAFGITPFEFTNDYDFALWKVNGLGCEALYNYSTNQPQPFSPVRCDYNSNPGAIGLDDSITGPGWSPTFPVAAGDTLILNVTNFSSTHTGYVLNFARSTAAFVPLPQPPANVGFAAASRQDAGLHPNPSQGFVTIDVPLGFDGAVEVGNLVGQLVHRRKSDAGQPSIVLDLRELPDGQYTVQLAGKHAGPAHRLVLRR